jgi:hypothetical protein
VPAISRVAVERVAQCPFSVAHEYAEDFLREAEREIALRVPIRDFIYGAGGHMHRRVKLVFGLHPDDTEEGRVHDAMLLEWRAGTRLFPQFHGTLRLRIETVESTRLTFEGAYRVPFGAAGALFDTVIGQRLARSTMADLLARIVAALERREAEYIASMPAAASSAS